MKKTPKRRVLKKKQLRRPSSFWCWLMARNNRKTRYFLVVSLCIVYVYVFYTFFVQPYGLRWRGVYGEADYPAGYSIRGIDISHHQGKIDWNQLQRAKIGDEPLSFVFMKATEGMSLIDREFDYNFKEAKEHGFIRGVYHFFVPGVPAKLQANHFIQKAKLEPGDLPPVLDIETVGSLSPEEIRYSTLSWLNIVEEEFGVTPILYTNYTFKKKYLNSSDFNKYPFWIAHYYVKKLPYDGEWKFWQHTDKGSLPGQKIRLYL